METPLLRDQQIPPSGEVIEYALKSGFPVFKKFMEIITTPEYGLIPEWNYYRDGKAWLCKVTFRKKTVFWLSVWGGYFKIAFYFVGRYCQGIEELDIDEKIKDDFKSRNSIGRLHPLILDISNMEHIGDAIKIIDYKKRLK